MCFHGNYLMILKVSQIDDVHSEFYDKEAWMFLETNRQEIDQLLINLFDIADIHQDFGGFYFGSQKAQLSHSFLVISSTQGCTFSPHVSYWLCLDFEKWFVEGGDLKSSEIFFEVLVPCFGTV